MKQNQVLLFVIMLAAASWSCAKVGSDSDVPSAAAPTGEASDSPSSGMTDEAASRLTREARRFMEDYGQDIRKNDGAAVAARYHPSGTYFKGGLMEYNDIVSSYTGEWEGPAAFEWRDLKIEILGPDAVLASGTGLWGREDTNTTMNVLYAAVLTRLDGKWYIRVEDETVLED